MAEDMFEEREKSEEARFKLNEEIRFKATAKRNRLLGLWAAELMGLAAAEADTYAREMVLAGLELNDAALAARLGGNLAEAGAEVEEKHVAEAMERLHAIALAEVARDYPMPLGPDHERVGDMESG